MEGTGVVRPTDRVDVELAATEVVRDRNLYAAGGKP